TNRIYKGNERRCRRQGCDRLMASPARIARDPRPLEGGDQSTLSMVSATGACESVATSTGADSRSPACGIALPDLLIRAATLTLENFDKVSAGVIAMASVSVIFAGNPEAFNRATASGIGGPSTARANTNSVSAGCTFAASFGSSLTVTLIAISFGAAVAADAGAGSAVASAAL